MTLRIISQQNDHPLYLTCNCEIFCNRFNYFSESNSPVSRYNQIQLGEEGMLEKGRVRFGIETSRMGRGGGGLDNFAAG